MLDAPPQTPSRPVRLRHASTSNPSPASQAVSFDASFSLLLSLPRELRERIYTFALTSPHPFSCPRPLQSLPEKFKHHVSVSLIRANKQVYEESISMLYSRNTFLFQHPSDCNIFRIVAAPASHNITSVFFRIREKDLRLWTSYLGSKTAERSLRFDLPKLKNLSISMLYRNLNVHTGLLAHGMQNNALAGLPPAIVVQVQAVQNALGQQIAALNHQDRNAEGGDDELSTHPPAIPLSQFQAGAVFPQPPPPPPAPVHHNPPHHHQAVPIVYGTPSPSANPPTHFLRFEREMGIEALCLALLETRRKDTDVKIVCTMRIPKREVERLVRMWPEEMERCDVWNARTRFRKVGGVDVSLEVCGYELLGMGGAL